MSAYAGQVTERDPYQELLDESRHREALAERARERSLRVQLREDARFLGTLRDLAEQGVALTLRSESGRAYHGRVVSVAADHLVLQAVDLGTVYVATDAVTDVRPDVAVRQEAATGERDATDDRTLAQVLARAAEDQPRIHLQVRGQSDGRSGTLVAAGSDVVSVQLDGDRAFTYVRVAAITECSLVT